MVVIFFVTLLVVGKLWLSASAFVRFMSRCDERQKRTETFVGLTMSLKSQSGANNALQMLSFETPVESKVVKCQFLHPLRTVCVHLAEL